VDHKIPISKGGLHCPSNLQHLPMPENRRKRAKLLAISVSARARPGLQNRVSAGSTPATGANREWGDLIEPMLAPQHPKFGTLVFAASVTALTNWPVGLLTPSIFSTLLI
jgi:hypothetical protein